MKADDDIELDVMDKSPHGGASTSGYEIVDDDVDAPAAATGEAIAWQRVRNVYVAETVTSDITVCLKR